MAEERTVYLEVVTPEGCIYNADVGMVTLPGVEGEFGVLPGHEPFVVLLEIGEMRVLRLDGTTDYVAIGVGYAAIRASRVLIVVDHGELAGAIDVARAEAERAEAEARLRELGDVASLAETDFYAVEQELKRAENRLRVAARVR